MTSGITYCAVAGTLPDIEVLAAEARSEGFQHIDRLVTEWRDGSMRFAADGELLMVALEGSVPVAIGGITRDPFVPGALRMRRFYTRRDCRGLGIGGELQRRLVAYGRRFVGHITVHAGSEAAARFWELCGFEPAAPGSLHTHELVTRPLP